MNALSDILSPESLFSLPQNFYKQPAREGANNSFVSKPFPPIYLCIDFPQIVLSLSQASAQLSQPMTSVVRKQVYFPNVSANP
jgi:hypothetical protein